MVNLHYGVCIRDGYLSVGKKAPPFKPPVKASTKSDIIKVNCKIVSLPERSHQVYFHYKCEHQATSICIHGKS